MMKEHSPEKVCSEIVVTCLLFHHLTQACDAVVTVDKDEYQDGSPTNEDRYTNIRC